MRISDWSSDVCSSDLVGEVGIAALPLVGAPGEGLGAPVVGQVVVAAVPGPFLRRSFQQAGNDVRRVERSEERRVGKECAVRVDLGGRRIIKKKKNNTEDIYNRINTRNTYMRQH